VEKCKLNFYLIGMTLILILFIPANLVVAGEFSADFTESQGDNVKTGKIYVTNNGYCMDITEDGEQIKVVVDNATNKTTIIQYSAKEFRTIASDDMMSVMNDPFQSYDYTLQYGEEVSAGSESFNGYDCDKSQISMSGTPVMTKWVAGKLGFPVKIVAHGPPDKVIELSNIVEGAIDPGLFIVPDGFSAWVDPDSKPADSPEWAGDIDSAPVIVPPFEKDMAAGDIIRVKIEPGKSLAVKGVSETEATAKTLPFIGKNPLKEESYYNNFAMKGTICQRMHEMSGEADEFIIRVYEGNVSVTAKWYEMFEQTLSAGEEASYTIVGDEHITTRIINLTDGNSTATFTFALNGQTLSDDEIGPAKYRQIELKNPWDIDIGSRLVKGDEMIIKVETGKMQIKLGQFDTFKF